MMALMVNSTKFVGTTTVASNDFIALLRNLQTMGSNGSEKNTKLRMEDGGLRTDDCKEDTGLSG